MAAEVTNKEERIFVVTALSLSVLTATVVLGYVGFIGVMGGFPVVSLDLFPLKFTSSSNLVFSETEKEFGSVTFSGKVKEGCGRGCFSFVSAMGIQHDALFLHRRMYLSLSRQRIRQRPKLFFQHFGLDQPASGNTKQVKNLILA